MLMMAIGMVKLVCWLSQSSYVHCSMKMKFLSVCGACVVFFGVNLPLCMGAEKCANQTLKEVCDGVMRMSDNGCCASGALNTLWPYIIVLGCLLLFILLTLSAICLVSIALCRFCLSRRKFSILHTDTT